MSNYYVNDTAQSNGDHEVHKEGCYWLSLVVRKTYLGNYNECRPAVTKAKQRYRTANGCIHCSLPCHTT